VQPALLATTAYPELNTLCLLRVHQARIVLRALLKLPVQLEHSELLFSVKLWEIVAHVRLVHRVAVVVVVKVLQVQPHVV